MGPPGADHLTPALAAGQAAASSSAKTRRAGTGTGTTGDPSRSSCWTSCCRRWFSAQPVDLGEQGAAVGLGIRQPAVRRSYGGVASPDGLEVEWDFTVVPGSFVPAPRCDERRVPDTPSQSLVPATRRPTDLIVYASPPPGQERNGTPAGRSARSRQAAGGSAASAQLPSWCRIGSSCVPVSVSW